MRTTGLVVVAVVIGVVGCFSTASYDDAHARRVASINARYEAELVQEQQHQAVLVAALAADQALLIPIKSGALSGPVSRVDEREAIVECRNHCDHRGVDASLDEIHPNGPITAQCLHDICEPAYVDALTKTYVDADAHWVTNQIAVSEGADLEALMAFSHNQAVARHIEDDRRALAQLQAQTRQRVERERQAEIAASAQRRDLEITSGRAAHRVRVQAAAFAARDRGPISPGPSSLCAAGDPRLSTITGCRSEPALPDVAPPPQTEQPPTQ
jgi:hypothetical protein